MKFLKIFICALVFLTWFNTAPAQVLTMADLNPLIASDWKGELTYRNYSDNKKVTMPCNLIVENKNANTLNLAYSYPDEANANSKSNIKIKAKGKKLGKQIVLEKQKLSDGTLVILTESKGKDNGKKAKFFYTYNVGKTIFSISKVVQYIGETEKNLRNKYSFKR